MFTHNSIQNSGTMGENNLFFCQVVTLESLWAHGKCSLSQTADDPQKQTADEATF